MEDPLMNTGILSLLFASSVLAPSWHNDYRQAQQQSAQQKKPLVMLFGVGTSGWTKVIRSESPNAEVSKLLSDQYVCMYVDTASAEGKTLAQHFDISGGVGMVISDRAGTSQAFWHQGDLPNTSAVHYLQKYADPQVVVRGTETVNSRLSYYPPTSQGSSRTSGSC
jgi:Protein of unknown function, DUF255